MPNRIRHGRQGLGLRTSPRQTKRVPGISEMQSIPPIGRRCKQYDDSKIRELENYQSLMRGSIKAGSEIKRLSLDKHATAIKLLAY